MIKIELILLSLIRLILIWTFGSNSIIKPKIQEINSKILLSCFFDQIKVETKLCEENNSMNEMKQELLKRFSSLYIFH